MYEVIYHLLKKKLKFLIKVCLMIQFDDLLKKIKFHKIVFNMACNNSHKHLTRKKY